MTIIRLMATDQRLTVTEKPVIASGDINSDVLHVDFSAEWDGYSRTAVFFTEANKKAVFEMVLAGGECKIPNEVLTKSGCMYIGVRGVLGADVKTSSLIKYKIVDGAPSGEGTTVEPTEDVYQQLLSAYQKAIDQCKQTEENVTAAYEKAQANIDQACEDVRKLKTLKLWENEASLTETHFDGDVTVPVDWTDYPFLHIQFATKTTVDDVEVHKLDDMRISTVSGGLYEARGFMPTIYDTLYFEKLVVRPFKLVDGGIWFGHADYLNEDSDSLLELPMDWYLKPYRIYGSACEGGMESSLTDAEGVAF